MIKRIIAAKWLLLAYALLFFIIVHNSQSYLDPDLGWHLRVGQDILEQNAVPRVDSYSTIAPDIKWVDHEWLFNIFVFFIFDRLGYSFLTFFFALMIISALVILHRQAHSLANGQNLRFFILFWLFLGLLGSRHSWGIRMQEITVLLLAVELSLLTGFERTGRMKYLAWLVPLFALWANLHGSFLVGLTVYLLYACYQWLAPAVAEKIGFLTILSPAEKMPKPWLNILIIYFFLIWLATLVNPYGLGLYGFLSTWGNGYYLTKISEWLPAWNYPFNFWQLGYFALAAAVSAIWSMSIRNKGFLRANGFRVLLSLLFFFLALKSRRHFPLFFTASLPVLAAVSEPLFAVERGFFSQLPLWRHIKTLTAICAVSLAGLTAAGIKNIDDPFKSYGNFYPVRAVEYLKEKPELIEKKLFNTYGWGGYLIWAWPEKKVFTDGRFPQTLHDGRTLLEEYYDFYDPDKLAAQIAEHGIELVLVSRPKPLELKWWEEILYRFDASEKTPANQPLVDYLEAANDWRIGYQDETSLIYTKK